MKIARIDMALTCTMGLSLHAPYMSQLEECGNAAMRNLALKDVSRTEVRTVQ